MWRETRLIDCGQHRRALVGRPPATQQSKAQVRLTQGGK